MGATTLEFLNLNARAVKNCSIITLFHDPLCLSAKSTKTCCLINFFKFELNELNPLSNNSVVSLPPDPHEKLS